LGIIQHWGYHGEQHKVNTSDGYVLTIQRIPCGKGQTPTPNRPVPHAFGVHISTNRPVKYRFLSEKCKFLL
jgi:hypothetical protein